MVSALRPNSPAEGGAASEHILHTHGIRKSQKPLMERKRRQRINRCLVELKSLVLEATKKEPSRYSKLEKADVLEMTVKHLRSMYRPDGSGRKTILADEMAKYRAGYAQCASEVSRFLTNISGVPQDLYSKVARHLNAVTISGRLGLGNSSNIKSLQSINDESSCEGVCLSNSSLQAKLVQDSSSISEGSRLVVGSGSLSVTAPSYNYLPRKSLRTENSFVGSSRNENISYYVSKVPHLVTQTNLNVTSVPTSFSTSPTMTSVPSSSSLLQKPTLQVPVSINQTSSPPLSSLSTSKALPPSVVTSPISHINSPTTSVFPYNKISYLSKNNNEYIGTLRISSDDKVSPHQSKVVVSTPAYYNIPPSSAKLELNDMNLNIKHSSIEGSSYPVAYVSIQSTQTSPWSQPVIIQQSKHSSSTISHSFSNIPRHLDHALISYSAKFQENTISNAESHRWQPGLVPQIYQEKLDSMSSIKYIQKGPIWRPW
ncbi:unnamed protein product, partial [Meganyctiphanes norvegica]